MSATVIQLNAIRDRRAHEDELRRETELRQEASGFAESLQDAMKRYRLNLPMMATLLMAKAVDALDDGQSPDRTEAEERESAGRLLEAILKARASARARAHVDAVRVFNAPA